MNLKQLTEIKEKEGDKEQGEVLGLPFLLWRHPSFWSWNGYVGVPKGSRLEGKNYNYYTESENGLSSFEEAINNLSVHGGVTFAGKLEDRTGDDYWYFGFDCSHGGDLVKYQLEQNMLYGNETYKTKEYAMNECIKLASQLNEILQTYSPKQITK